MTNVLLNHCRIPPPPPNTAPIPSTPQLLSTENYPDGSPGASSDRTARPSAATPQYHGSPDPNSQENPSDPAAQASENPSDPPTQPDLLQLGLQAALGHCEDAELQGFLEEFKNGKEKDRYVPLAKALNRGLLLSSTMQVPGIRGPSELKPLFVVSDPDRFHWRSGVQRSPDLTLLSLSATRQLYEMPEAEWNSLSEACSAPPENAKFEWPDALAPVEVKWNDNPIQSVIPTKQTTCLAPISHLSVDDERKDSAEDTSSNTAPASTTASSSIPSSRRVQSPLSIGSSNNLAPGSIPSSHSGHSSANVSGQGATSSRPRPPKRTSDHLGSDSSPPLKQHKHKKVTRSDVVIQSAGNGAEMLHCSLGRHHSICIAIIDSKLWLWWYDPQGAIQTTGIDFIRNLPHLLVLLFALQRLTLVDWGFNPELDPSITLRHLPQPPETGSSTSDPPQGPTSNPSTSSTNHSGRTSAGDHQQCASSDGQQGEETSTNDKKEKSSNKKASRKSKAPMPRIQPMSASVTINKELEIQYDVPMLNPLHAPFCAKGRSTKSFRVTDASDAKASDGSPKRYVAKLYWPYMSRFKEEDLIKEARGVADDLGNHLPYVFGSRDIDPMGTFRIRQDLGLNPTTSSARALRMLIFEPLIPITDLQGDQFLIALVQCIRCHFVLWHNGIRHQDISLANLMVRIVNKVNYGVLNDWDLSFWVDKGKFEADLTATVPYVAIRLLHFWQKNTVQERVYYFDLESFFWCIIWAFFAFKNKSFQPLPSVTGWLTANIYQSAEKRGDFFRRPEDFQSHEEWKPCWDIVIKTAEWVEGHWKPDPAAIREKSPEVLRAESLELLRGFLGVVSENFSRLKMPTSPVVEGL